MTNLDETLTRTEPMPAEELKRHGRALLQDQLRPLAGVAMLSGAWWLVFRLVEAIGLSARSATSTWPDFIRQALFVAAVLVGLPGAVVEFAMGYAKALVLQDRAGPYEVAFVLAGLIALIGWRHSRRLAQVAFDAACAYERYRAVQEEKVLLAGGEAVRRWHRAGDLSNQVAAGLERARNQQSAVFKSMANTWSGVVIGVFIGVATLAEFIANALQN